MNEQELIEKARSEGATDFSRWLKSFWRRGKNGLEICQIEGEKLGQWQRDWRSKPSESSRRI